MRVKIRTSDFRFFMPMPTALIGFALSSIPEKVFEKMRAKAPEPYSALITKENVKMLWGECKHILKENKDLEILHLEEKDGTLISVKL